MSVEELKSRLLKANKAYREGSPFMTDQEFDDLCDELQSMVDPADWAKFRDGLNEGPVTSPVSFTTHVSLAFRRKRLTRLLTMEPPIYSTKSGI